MKISELISKLTDIKNEFGDLIVEKDANENFSVRDLVVINEDGHETKSKSAAYSVWIE